MWRRWPCWRGREVLRPARGPNRRGGSRRQSRRRGRGGGRGQGVEPGGGLVVIEARKMENELGAPRAGVVREVHVAAGQAVERGAPLVTLASPDQGASGSTS